MSFRELVCSTAQQVTSQHIVLSSVQFIMKQSAQSSKVSQTGDWAERFFEESWSYLHGDIETRNEQPVGLLRKGIVESKKNSRPGYTVQHMDQSEVSSTERKHTACQVEWPMSQLLMIYHSPDHVCCSWREGKDNFKYNWVSAWEQLMSEIQLVWGIMWGGRELRSCTMSCIMIVLSGMTCR